MSTIHPDLHGLPHMIPLLEESIEYVKSKDGAEFHTLKTIALMYKDDPAL